MRRWLAFLFLLLPLPLWATTTVTGTLQNLGTGTVGQAAFVRFWLRGCGGNQPRVSGTAVIAPSQGGVFYFDFAANGSGAISGTLYSTRDVTGLLGGDITCGTSTTSVWYGMQIFVGGKGGPEIPVHALNTATLNISSVTPISVTPVVPAPTGDGTYIRKDGGNNPIPGALQFQGNNTHSGTETFKYLNNIRFADQFAGADWAAKINAADADIGSNVAGTIIVPSGLAGAATTTMAPTSNKQIIFMGGTFSSSAAPNIAPGTHDGIVISGSGIGTILNNTGTGRTIDLGDGATQLRWIFVRDLQLTGTASASDAIRLQAHVGHVVLSRLLINTFGGFGINGAAGDYFFVTIEQVRITAAANVSFNFPSTLPNGPVTFIDDYSNGPTGTAYGWDVENGDYSFYHTYSDTGAQGYRIASNVKMHGTASNGNTVAGINVIGAGSMLIEGHSGSGDGIPILVAAAGANVRMVAPVTSSTVGAESILVQTAATGDNRLYGSGGLDKAPVIQAGGILKYDTGNGWQCPEGAAITGAAGYDQLWCDATSHRLKMNNNNGGAKTIAGLESDTFSNLQVGLGALSAIKDSTGATSMGLTLKKGSGGGNYTNATTAYTVADSTNLCFTVTIPTGWKLGISASGALSTATAAVVAQASLTDNAACSTANAGILVETAPIQGAAIGVADAFALNWVITGDGASHNVALQFKTSNAADTASLINSSATITPTMKFELMPSN